MRVHHRNLLLKFSVGVFGCVLAYNVKYISYYDQGQKSQEATDCSNFPISQKGVWCGKENLWSREGK